MRWFYDLKTMQKLAISFGVMIAALCGVAYLGMHAAEDARQSWELAFKRDLQGLDAARRVDIARLNAARYFRAAMLLRDDAKKAEFVRRIDESDAEMRAALDEVDAKSVLPETHRRTADVRRLLPEFISQAKEAARLSSVDMTKALEGHARCTELGNRIGEDTAAIANGKKDLAANNFKEGLLSFERSRDTVVAVSVAAVAFGVLFAFAVGRIISRPLAKAVAILDRVAAGDLSQTLDVQSKDEVGQMAEALNRSVASMRTTLTNVTEVAMEVSSASTQLAAGAEQISSGAQEQAASLEETAASLEEISSTVKQNADNAQQAAQLASGARDAAERGGQVVESAVEAMTEITTSSKRIADIITTIDEIAFQTNLLALNAAVEAARAGEQGRGFGVVAAEVRTLAQRTASAAREIRGLIADASSKVEVGTTQVNQSGETLTEIVRSVKRVTDMIAEIAAASREQTSGIDQVNTAVTQVDQVTQANASQTEELSATATSLRDKSTYLRELVSAFNLGQQASGARMEAPRRVSPPPIPKAANSNARLPSAKHSVQRMPAAAPAPMQRASGFEEF